MSRPDDGQKTHFPFGNPFRSIFPRSSYRSTKLSALLYSFEQVLAERLRKLNPVQKSEVLSLSWMRQAVKCLCDTHTDIKDLITDLRFPVSDWDEKWLDMYLDTSVKLLDVCIALSSEISKMDHCRLILQYVLHVLDLASGEVPSSGKMTKVQASLHDLMLKIRAGNHKLENFALILQGLVGPQYSTKAKNSTKGKILVRAFHGVKVVSIFICSVITAALSGCSNYLIELHVPDHFLWAEAFKSLQVDVLGEVRSRLSQGKQITVKELEEVEICVQKLHILTNVNNTDENLQQGNDGGHELLGTGEGIRMEEGAHKVNVASKEVTSQQLKGAFQELIVLPNASLQEKERLQESVVQLAESSETFSKGVNVLSKQVDDFFEIVLTGRDALLSNLRTPDLAKEQKCN